MSKPKSNEETVEEYVQTFIKSYRLLRSNGMYASDKEVESYIRKFISTLLAQKDKEVAEAYQKGLEDGAKMVTDSFDIKLRTPKK